MSREETLADQVAGLLAWKQDAEARLLEHERLLCTLSHVFKQASDALNSGVGQADVGNNGNAASIAMMQTRLALLEAAVESSGSAASGTSTPRQVNVCFSVLLT
jgi:hypothetical protein